MIVPVVIASESKCVKTYAMLDGGSNCDVINRRLANELQLNMSRVDSTLLLSVEGGRYGPREFTEFAVGNLEGDVTLTVTDALVSDFLTTDEERPPTNQEIEGIEYLEGVKFDELDNKEIGLLISMRHAWTWLSGESRESTQDKPMAKKTKFGWALAGGKGENSEKVNSCFKATVSRDDELRENIEKLWRNEFPNISKSTKHASLEDDHAISQLKDTIVFDDGLGHYRVGLPWVKSRTEAAKTLNSVNSSKPAFDRIVKSVRKLKGQPQQWTYVKKQMSAMMEEHGEVVENPEVPEEIPQWVLPLHFDFRKPEKPRPCHDGKSKTSGVCLNEQLLTGPDLLNSLTGVLFRFRKEKIAVSADIKGFFHQVYVDENDVHVFRFWWYQDENYEIPCLCELKVHIFGAKSSPTVATFALRHHATGNLRGDLLGYPKEFLC